MFLSFYDNIGHIYLHHWPGTKTLKEKSWGTLSTTHIMTMFSEVHCGESEEKSALFFGGMKTESVMGYRDNTATTQNLLLIIKMHVGNVTDISNTPLSHLNKTVHQGNCEKASQWFPVKTFFIGKHTLETFLITHIMQNWCHTWLFILTISSDGIINFKKLQWPQQ